MPFLEWKEEYSVNVASIDEQHRKLFSIINDLHEAMKQGKGWDILTRTIDELIEYSDYHFLTEEGLMSKASYPDLGTHIEQHRIFRERVTLIAKEAKEGNFVMTLELNEFLMEWLKAHVLGSDRSYVERFMLYGIH